jgi:ribosomal protein S3
VSGKLRAQRAKSMKFKDGYMVSSGDPVRLYIDGAVRHVMLRQGVLGIKVCMHEGAVFVGDTTRPSKGPSFLCAHCVCGDLVMQGSGQ